MKYESKNSGLLSIGHVKTGDKLLILENAYSVFSESKQKTYWNVKVELPNKEHKLAGLMDSTCDQFAEKWGEMTENWTGHTCVVQIKTSKSGNDYITLIPTDDLKVDIEANRVEAYKKDVARIEKENEGVDDKKIEYPKDDIDPNDIPFN